MVNKNATRTHIKYLDKKSLVLIISIVVIIPTSIWFFAASNPQIVRNENNNDCSGDKLNKMSKEKIFGRFEDYPVIENFDGKFASLDLKSSFIAKRFKTTINNALSKNKVNFAGHYVIAEWGFTGVGGMMAVIDVTNGKAYPFPYIDKFGFDYRSDSNLIIVDSLKIISDVRRDDPDIICSSYSENIRPYYFIFENNTFRLLGPKDRPFPNESDWMKP